MNNEKKILSQEECLATILKNVNSGYETSFIRKGDGENIIIGYRTLNKVSFFKYRKKLVHFNISIWDISFQKFIREELIKACKSASILGISLLEHRHGFWSIEESIIKELSLSDIQFGDVNFHMGFIKIPFQKKLLNPIAEEIITNRKIGIIGHPNVDEFLHNYNSQVIIKLEIPKRRSKFQRMSRKKYDAILLDIANINHHLDIWLVAAGAYAKPFCEYIRKIGGIGIDIGSSLDTWGNEYHSRGHLRKIYKQYEMKQNSLSV